MSDHVDKDILAEGRQMLEQATQIYERPLLPVDYWWLGVGLAACTLAELEEKTYAVGRIEQLMDRLGHKGPQGDWFQRFTEELAGLNAEGLLWPVYQRSTDGPLQPTGLEVDANFDARAGYYLALAHLGVAVAVNQEDSDRIDHLAEVIAGMVERGLQPGDEPAILAALEPLGDEAEQETPNA